MRYLTDGFTWRPKDFGPDSLFIQHHPFERGPHFTSIRPTPRPDSNCSRDHDVLLEEEERAIIRRAFPLVSPTDIRWTVVYELLIKNDGDHSKVEAMSASDLIQILKRWPHYFPIRQDTISNRKSPKLPGKLGIFAQSLHHRFWQIKFRVDCDCWLQLPGIPRISKTLTRWNNEPVDKIRALRDECLKELSSGTDRPAFYDDVFHRVHEMYSELEKQRMAADEISEWLLGIGEQREGSTDPLKLRDSDNLDWCIKWLDQHYLEIDEWFEKSRLSNGARQSVIPQEVIASGTAVTKEQCNSVRDAALSCFRLHHSTRMLLLGPDNSVLLQYLDALQDECIRLCRIFDASWSDAVRDHFYLNVAERGVKIGGYPTAMEFVRHLVEQLNIDAWLPHLILGDDGPEILPRLEMISLYKTLNERLQGESDVFYQSEIMSEWAAAVKSLSRDSDEQTTIHLKRQVLVPPSQPVKSKDDDPESLTDFMPPKTLRKLLSTASTEAAITKEQCNDVLLAARTCANVVFGQRIFIDAAINNWIVLNNRSMRQEKYPLFDDANWKRLSQSILQFIDHHEEQTKELFRKSWTADVAEHFISYRPDTSKRFDSVFQKHLTACEYVNRIMVERFYVLHHLTVSHAHAQDFIKQNSGESRIGELDISELNNMKLEDTDIVSEWAAAVRAISPNSESFRISTERNLVTADLNEYRRLEEPQTIAEQTGNPPPQSSDAKSAKPPHPTRPVVHVGDNPHIVIGKDPFTLKPDGAEYLKVLIDHGDWLSDPEYCKMNPTAVRPDRYRKVLPDAVKQHIETHKNKGSRWIDVHTPQT